MISQVNATVVHGALQLDQPLPLPDQSRVRVQIEPIEEIGAGWPQRFAAFQRLCDERPIDSGGRRWTRDELHERR